jgi:hypothetical protein
MNYLGIDVHVETTVWRLLNDGGAIFAQGKTATAQVTSISFDPHFWVQSIDGRNIPSSVRSSNGLWITSATFMPANFRSTSCSP